MLDPISNQNSWISLPYFRPQNHFTHQKKNLKNNNNSRISHSFASLTRILSAREDKIRIPARPCNILYNQSDSESLK